MKTDSDLGPLFIIYETEPVTGYIVKGSYISATIPTTASKFSLGCEIVNRASGIVYRNAGTVASPSWQNVDEITTGEIADLAVTAGKLAAALDISGKTVTLPSLAQNLDVARTLTSQTAINTSETIALTTDSTYLGGTNITYSGGLGSNTIRSTATWSATAGGLANIQAITNATGALNDANGGALSLKGVTTTSAALTAGNVYGGQFIARHNHGTNKAANATPFVGVEGVVTQSTAGQIGTAIGVSAAYHIPADAAAYDGGAVFRGLQITCDNSGSNAPSEETGLAIWNMAGTQTNAIKIIKSATGFTNDIVFQNGEVLNNAVDGYLNTDAALTITGVGGAGLASALRLAFAETSAGAQTATMTNAPAAGNPTKWLSVWYDNVKYVIPMFPSA